MDQYLFSASLSYSQKLTPRPSYNETSLHTHDKYELLYFEAGDAELILEDRKLLLSLGDMILLPPHVRHRINLVSPLPYRRSVINFSHLPLRAAMPLFARPVVLNVATDERICALMERMKDYSTLFQKELRLSALQCLVTELLVLLTRHMTEPAPAAYGSFMTNALSYIEHHLTEINDISCLCDELHVSRSYLYREFQHALGLSPMRYIQNKRLQMAQHLLRIGEEATMVCFRCGYREYSAFYRAYRAYFGYAPKETLSHQNP